MTDATGRSRGRGVSSVLAVVLAVVLATSGLAMAMLGSRGMTEPSVAEASTTPSVQVTTDGSVPPAAPVAQMHTTGPLPSAVLEVLQAAAGAGTTDVEVLDAAALATHVPSAVADVLTQRGAVLTIPPAANPSAVRP